MGSGFERALKKEWGKSELKSIDDQRQHIALRALGIGAKQASRSSRGDVVSAITTWEESKGKLAGEERRAFVVFPVSCSACPA